MPVFKDSEAMRPFVPEGDYILCVTDFTIGISTGKKTSGSEKYDLEFEVEGSGCRVFEGLIDAESTAWKIDCFLKSSGVRTLKKGEPFSFREDEAKREGWVWVNPMGLRCHAHLVIDTYSPAGSAEKKTKNKVGVFYTDKPDLPPNESLRVSEPAKIVEEEDIPF